MSEELIVRYCSPTLAGLKTGNLFSCKVESLTELKNKIDYVNDLLNSKGVCVCLLKLWSNRALIYVFRPSKLKNDLSRKGADVLLNKAGYIGKSLFGDIKHLADRIENCNEFPHEIGLFLGYPIEDIYGFIANKGKNCKCTGCWKVYNNECEAKKTFAKYKKCTDVYCKKLSDGLSILSLTITA